MFNFLLLVVVGIAGFIYAWPRIRAYQAAIGVPDAIEKAGDSIITRIRLRLLGLKTIILGYVALFISAVPDILTEIPEIHHTLDQLDLSIWLSPQGVILAHNLLNIAMLLTRLAGMTVIVNGVPTRRGEAA
ncbi:hypothetical protein [Beijerinckia mobilis]|uniref:hypothetical protein n=1 Tax=Beijerinckia mobilis TaxID=231434 RepID=UPI000556419C|nr:hypothetical protein [Beijerinckia mobilis]